MSTSAPTSSKNNKLFEIVSSSQSISKNLETRGRFAILALKTSVKAIQDLALGILLSPCLLFSNTFPSLANKSLADLTAFSTHFLLTFRYISGIIFPLSTARQLKFQEIIESEDSSVSEAVKAMIEYKKDCKLDCFKEEGLHSYFNTLLKKDGHQPQHIIGGGNCLFGSTAWQIRDTYHPEITSMLEKARLLRLDVVAHLKTHQDSFLQDVIGTLSDLDARGEIERQELFPANYPDFLKKNIKTIADDLWKIILNDFEKNLLPPSFSRNKIIKFVQSLCKKEKNDPSTCKYTETSRQWLLHYVKEMPRLRNYLFKMYTKEFSTPSFESREAHHSWVWEQVQAHPLLQQHLFNLYCEEMEKEGTWGQGIEMRAIAEIFNRPVFNYCHLILNNTKDENILENGHIRPYQIFGFDSKNEMFKGKPIQVVYDGSGHYISA